MTALLVVGLALFLNDGMHQGKLLFGLTSDIPVATAFLLGFIVGLVALEYIRQALPQKKFVQSLDKINLAFIILIVVYIQAVLLLGGMYDTIIKLYLMQYLAIFVGISVIVAVILLAHKNRI